MIKDCCEIRGKKGLEEESLGRKKSSEKGKPSVFEDGFFG